MKLDEIHKMWAQDCIINKSDLFTESVRSPILHAKYLEMYSKAKLRLVKLEMDQKVLLKDKWLYYNGKMSKSEIEERGWEFDPFDGLRVLKGEMDYYYDADTDIQNSEIKIRLQKEIISTLKEIIDNIKWRSQTIKNMIEWRKFEAGG